LRQNGAGESAPFHPGDRTVGHPVAVRSNFHRGQWCPYCRINTNALAQAHQQISSEGGQIVAIMPDREQFSSALKIVGRIPFPILTDMDNGYALSLNLAIWIGPKKRWWTARIFRPTRGLVPGCFRFRRPSS
jgi:peroxiredoxin